MGGPGSGVEPGRRQAREDGAMTHEEWRRRVDAVYRWAQEHGAGESECPVCRGIKWEFKPETPGPYLPRVCFSCGHIQWFDAKRLGVEPAAPAERFEKVLAAYLEAVDAGWAPTRSHLL